MKQNTIKEYEMILEQFAHGTGEIYKDSNYPYGPFIPYVFENYCSAPKKVFFMGQDTYCWVKAEEYLSLMESSNYKGYISKNSNIVTGERLLCSPDEIDSHGYDGMDSGSGFWGFVQKAYIYYRTDKYYPTLKSCSPDIRKHIYEIGYSEAFSIELPKSLENEGCWNNIDHEKYFKIANDAKPLVDAKRLIDIYEPDAIVLLNWSDDVDCFINLTKEESHVIKKSVLTVDIFKENKTKLFWMRHPSNFHRMGYNDEEMAEILVSAMKQYIK